jgi:hypothetical protein|tara:strand:+ start:461 stop:697 length:237 start_codon:yes stop_codon:yes gene_type:complete
MYYTKILTKCQEVFLRCQKIVVDLALLFWYNIFMNEIDYAYLAWLALAIWGAYKLGKREGISATLDYMKEKKQIDFDE